MLEAYVTEVDTSPSLLGLRSPMLSRVSALPQIRSWSSCVAGGQWWGGGGLWWGGGQDPDLPT